MLRLLVRCEARVRPLGAIGDKLDKLAAEAAQICTRGRPALVAAGARSLAVRRWSVHNQAPVILGGPLWDVLELNDGRAREARLDWGHHHQRALEGGQLIGRALTARVLLIHRRKLRQREQGAARRSDAVKDGGWQRTETQGARQVRGSRFGTSLGAGHS